MKEKRRPVDNMAWLHTIRNLFARLDKIVVDHFGYYIQLPHSQAERTYTVNVLAKCCLPNALAAV